MTHVYTRERHENKNTRFWATYAQTELYKIVFSHISPSFSECYCARRRFRNFFIGQETIYNNCIFHLVSVVGQLNQILNSNMLTKLKSNMMYCPFYSLCKSITTIFSNLRSRDILKQVTFS